MIRFDGSIVAGLKGVTWIHDQPNDVEAIELDISFSGVVKRKQALQLVESTLSEAELAWLTPKSETEWLVHGNALRTYFDGVIPNWPWLSETLVVEPVVESDDAISAGRVGGHRTVFRLYLDNESVAQSYNNSDALPESMSRRFQVALSFPGERREFVRAVAEHLATVIPRVSILYDEWYEAEFARPNLDTYLQELYRKQSELIAVFICAHYEQKNWCGLEWRAIREVIMDRRDASVMPLRFDDTEIPGLFANDGYIWIGEREPGAIGDLILQRLNLAETRETHPEFESNNEGNSSSDDEARLIKLTGLVSEVDELLKRFDQAFRDDTGTTRNVRMTEDRTSVEQDAVRWIKETPAILDELRLGWGARFSDIGTPTRPQMAVGKTHHREAGCLRLHRTRLVELITSLH